MKRNTSLVTVSLPPQMLKESAKLAYRTNMTRSELLRTALRKYIEASVTAQDKKSLKKFEAEDAKLWAKIETDLRKVRSSITRKRYPYLYE